MKLLRYFVDLSQPVSSGQPKSPEHVPEIESPAYVKLFKGRDIGKESVIEKLARIVQNVQEVNALIKHCPPKDSGFIANV
jgi:hypothetical protein